MRHRVLTPLALLAWHLPFTEPANHVFSNADNSEQDKYDALVAGQIVFPVIFGQIRRLAWNEYAKQKSVSDLVMEEELEEQKIRKIKPGQEADEYINNARTDGLNRDLYHDQYNTVVLDGTLTVMGEANDTYTQRSVYLKTGGGMVIPCMLASIPMDSFMWYDDIDGQRFNSKFSGALTVNEKKQLSVHNAEPIMSGIYRCIGSNKGHDTKNVVHLYVYKTADPGLMFRVHFRMADCDESKIIYRQNEFLKFLCEGDIDESCVDEKVPTCRMETKVEASQLRGRLEFVFIRYDTDFENECTGQCEAEKKTARILAKRPFKDLRKGLLDYLAYDDRLYETHARDYLWDPVRTLAEGYYTKHQTYRCPPGFRVDKVQNKAACVPCFAGSSKANLSRGAVCPECAVGFYAPAAALQYCEICPMELGTIADRKGNKKQDACFSRPVTYQQKPALEMDFAGFDDEAQKQQTKQSSTKTTIIIIVFVSIVVVAIGGFLCYMQRKAKKEEVTEKAGVPSEAGPEEKRPLAPSKVPSITVPQAKKNQNATANESPFGFLTQALGVSTAKQEGPTEAKKATDDDEDKTVETKKRGEDATGEEAKKAREKDKNATAEAKRSKDSDEDDGLKRNAGSKSEKRSSSSDDDTPKPNPSVPGLTPGGPTTPAQAATPYASTNPSTYSTAFASVTPTPAQSFHAGVPPQMAAQSGKPPQTTGQPESHQEG